MPKMETAQPKQTGLDIAQRTEITATELEAPLTLAITPETKISHVSFEEEKSIEITMTDAQDKEELLIEKEKPLTSEATIDYDVQKVALTFEVISNSELGNLPQENIVDILPKSSLLPYQSTQVEETLVQEKEMTLSDIPRSDRNAEISFEIGESLSISAVDVIENENDLHTPERAETKTVSTSITAHSVAQATETIPSNNINFFESTTPFTTSAKIDHSPLYGIVTSEISVADVENSLDNFVIPDKKKSDVTFEENISLEITVTNTQDKEQLFIGKEKPLTSEATVDFDGQKVASTFEVISNSELGNLPQENIVDVLPTSSLLPYQSTQIEETLVQEKEMPLSDISRNDRNAEISFEIGESLSISAVDIIEKENDLLTPERTETMTASTSINAHSVAQATETIPSNNINFFESTTPFTTSAKIDHSPLYGIVTSEISVADAEYSLADFVIPDEKKSDVTFEENMSLEVTETIMSDKENKYIKDNEINLQTALPKYDSHKVAESTEITPEMVPGDLISKLPDSATAVEQHTLCESLIQEEIIISDKEKDLKDKPILSKDNKANVNIEESVGVSTITEIITDDKEGDLKAFIQPEGKLVQIELVGHKVAEKLEININISSGDLEEQRPTLVSATQKPITLESVLTEETQVNETEGIFSKQTIPEKQSVTENVDTFQSLIYTETHVSEQEISFENLEISLEKTAIVNLRGDQIAEITEVTPLSNVEDFRKPDMIEERYGQTKIDELNSLIILENQSIENEEQFISKDSPAEQTVSKSVSGRDVAQTTEITPVDNTVELISEVMPKEYEGKPQITEMQSVKVSEVLFNEKETDLNNVLEMDTKLAHPEISPIEVIETTEVITTSNTTDLKSDKIVDSRTSTTEMHALSSAIISEILTTEREKDLTIKREYESEMITNESYVGNTAAQVLETTAADCLSEFETSLPSQQKGTPQIEEILPLTVSETIIDEVEKNLITAQKVKSVIANTNVVGREVAETSQTIVDSSTELLEEYKTPSEKIVQLHIQDVLPSTIVSEIIPHESENSLSILEAPTKQTAIPHIKDNEATLVSEIYEITNTIDISNNQEPISQQIASQMDEMSAINISQVISNESGDTFQPSKLPHSTSAKMMITGAEAVQTEEVITTSHVIEGKYDHPSSIKQEIAEISVSGRDIAQILLIEPFNSEQIIDQKETPVTKTGTLHLSEITPLIITQTQSNEKEIILDQRSSIKEFVAESSIISQNVAEKLEIETGLSIANLPRSEIISEQTSISNVEKMNSLVVSETVTEERETPKEITKLSEAKATPALSTIDVPEQLQIVTANIVEDIIEKRSAEKVKPKSVQEHFETVQITEVTCAEKETMVRTKDIPKDYYAHINVEEHNAPQITETVTTIATEKMDEVKLPESNRTEYQTIPFKAIENTETTVHESEIKLDTERRPSIANAQIGFKISEGIQITEILAEENKPKTIETKSGKEVKAEVEITKTLVAIKSETQPESTITELPSNKITSITAKEVTDIQHGIVILDQNTEETETNIFEYTQPHQKKAGIALEADHLHDIGKYYTQQSCKNMNMLKNLIKNAKYKLRNSTQCNAQIITMRKK